MTNRTQKKAKRKTRQEINDESRRLKRLKKRKGNPPGSRITDDGQKKKGKTTELVTDPRIGSKKPVPLVGEVKKKPVVEPVVKLTPAQELEKLENDIKLDLLLERLENDEVLTAQEQDYVDNTLDRIDELMKILGIEFEDDEEEDETPENGKEDILNLLRRT